MAFGIAPALAADIVWTGGPFNSDWLFAPNWAGGVKPSFFDNALITNPATIGQAVEIMGAEAASRVDIFGGNSLIVYYNLQVTNGTATIQVGDGVSTGLVTNFFGIVNATTTQISNTGTVLNDLGSLYWEGNATNAGSWTSNAIWNGNVTNSGTATNNNALNGTISNSSTFNNTGTVSGLLTNTAGTTTNSGQLNGGATITGGTLTTTGIINGGLTNSATVNAAGTVNGAVANNSTATFTVSGALTGDSTFSNTGTAKLAVTGGNYTGLTTITNTSTNGTGGIEISSGRTLGATTINNNSGGTIVSAGTISAALNNNNASTISASGAVNGAVTNNNTATFAVSGALTGNSTFGNTGTAKLAVTGGNYTGLTTITNTSTNGTGGIEVSSGRTLSATTIDNNSGGTIVSAGTITAALNNNNASTINASGAVNGAVTNNNTATFTVSAPLTGNSTFSNIGTAKLAVTGGNYTGLTTITNTSTNGTGGIEVSSGRTLSATTIDNNSGGTIVSAGTITAAVNNNNASTISASGTINGAATNNDTAVFTVSGALTGSSTFANSGAAQLVVTGGNYTGLTAITNTSTNGTGGIQISSGRTLGATIINNNSGGTIVSAGTILASVNNNNASTISGSGTVNGAITNNDTATFTVSGALTSNNSFSNTGAAQLNVTGGNYTGLTTLTNSSSNAAAVNITAGNTLSANTVVNNAGGLIVNGVLTATTGLTVNGGFVGGTGTLPTTTIASGGTLAPGNSIGTINVNGPLTFSAGSNYNIEVSPAASDRTNVTGSATLGGTVNASFAAGTYVVKKYTILNATGGVGGAFGSIVNSNLPSGFKTSLSYDASNAYLDLALSFIPPPSTGLGGNQSSVGNALVNYFNTNGGIPLVFGGLTVNGLSQASGQPGASTAQSGFAATGQFVNGVFDGAFGDGPGQGGATGFAQEDDNANAYAAKRNVSREVKEAYAAVTPRDRRAPSFEQRWAVWASAYGGNSRVNGDTTAGTNSTTNRVFGAVAGASYHFTPDTQAGFSLGGAGSSFDIANGFGGGRADVFNAAVYAKHTWGAAYVAGLIGYSWQDTTTDRTVTIAGVDKLHASFQAQVLATRLEGGWRYATPMVGITPYAALQATTFYLPSYGETATSGSNTFALNYASKSVTATRSELGAKFDKAMPVQGGVFTLKARAAWAHDWNTDRSAIATFQTLPGATFTTNGAQPSADAALASLGAEMKWHNGWTVAGRFDGEFSRTSAGYAGKGSVRYAW